VKFEMTKRQKVLWKRASLWHTSCLALLVRLCGC
jgi:hypothetical protein